MGEYPSFGDIVSRNGSSRRMLVVDFAADGSLICAWKASPKAPAREGLFRPSALVLVGRPAMMR